jgi:hypothetical protein
MSEIIPEGSNEVRRRELAKSKRERLVLELISSPFCPCALRTALLANFPAVKRKWVVRQERAQ